MREVSDEALLAGLGAGDRDAAVAFVRRFQSRVYGVAVSVVGDRALAEDVAQEAFARAWRHAGAYDPRRGAVLPWLLTIVRNAAIDAVRSRRARPVDLGELPARLAATEPWPDERAVRTEAVDRVRTALAALPSEQRFAVMHAAYAGRTAQELSDAVGIPLGTAKTRIRSGLMRVRDLLGALEDER
jgi:RNA polymerase sigma factor (sigma-70 family)